MLNKKSIVLLSAGLDSTVNLFLAHQKTKVVKTITFDYGQIAAVKEIEKAQQISKQLGLENTVIDLPWLKKVSGSALTDSNKKVPVNTDIAIDDLQISLKSAKSVWVPNRNGVFLNIAASFADAYSIDYIIPGFNLEEAATFPDNSENFMTSINESFTFSTSNQVKVVSYTVQMTKSEIVKIALDQKIPLDLIWPCYFSGPEWCGQCESCLRTLRAFKLNNFKL